MKVHAFLVFIIVITTIIFCALSTTCIYYFSPNGAVAMIFGVAALSFFSAIIGKYIYED